MICNQKIIIYFSLLFCFSFIQNVNFALAQACTCNNGDQSFADCGFMCNDYCSQAGRNNVRSCFEAGTSGTAGSQGTGGGSVSLDNPLPTGTNINEIIGKAINGVLGIVGSLALVMVIYGGLTWMLAAGNQTRVQKGRDILVWAVVGLVVIFSAYAMVRFVFVNIFGAA